MQLGIESYFNESHKNSSQTTPESIKAGKCENGSLLESMKTSSNVNQDSTLQDDEESLEPFLVSLEVSKDQRHRNEKRNKKVDDSQGSHSKRIKIINEIIIKTEPNYGSKELLKLENPLDIDKVKQEVFEADVPILNVPVQETSETDFKLYESHLTENLFESCENEDFYGDAGKCLVFGT